MFILLVIISIIAIIVDLTLDLSDEIISCIAFVVLLIGIVGAGWNLRIVINGTVIDETIDMYTEENEKIESNINDLVVRYMEYESETLGELKSDSAITLVSLYPELKADELIKTQIETYQANSNYIKRLKEKKIDVTVAKWWLYFGK